MRAAPRDRGRGPRRIVFPGGCFGRTRPGRMEEMTVPLDDVNDIRAVDAAGIPAVLEADLGAPRKQRHTARRIYDRLVAERGYGGSYSTVQRRVREWRAARRAGGGEGYLELEWAPGTAQINFGDFEADVAGERLALKLLVVYALQRHSSGRLLPAGPLRHRLSGGVRPPLCGLSV